VTSGLKPGSMLPPRPRCSSGSRSSCVVARGVADPRGARAHHHQVRAWRRPDRGRTQPADFGRMAAPLLRDERCDLSRARRGASDPRAGDGRQAALRNDPSWSRACGHGRRCRPNDLQNSASYGRVSSDFHSAITGASGNRILDCSGAPSKRSSWSASTAWCSLPRTVSGSATSTRQSSTRSPRKRRQGESLMHAHMEEFADRVAKRYPGMLDEVVDWR